MRIVHDWDCFIKRQWNVLERELVTVDGWTDTSRQAASQLKLVPDKHTL